jgi:hypothetical protein
MKKIHSSLDEISIGYIVSMLEQQGIAFTIRNQFLSGAFGELPATECWPEIWVTHDEDYDKAMHIVDLAEVEADDDAGPWRCRCGERNEGQFGSCWKCGTDRN